MILKEKEDILFIKNKMVQGQAEILGRKFIKFMGVDIEIRMLKIKEIIGIANEEKIIIRPFAIIVDKTRPYGKLTKTDIVTAKLTSQNRRRTK